MFAALSKRCASRARDRTQAVRGENTQHSVCFNTVPQGQAHAGKFCCEDASQKWSSPHLSCALPRQAPTGEIRNMSGQQCTSQGNSGSPLTDSMLNSLEVFLRQWRRVAGDRLLPQPASRVTKYAFSHVGITFFAMPQVCMQKNCSHCPSEYGTHLTKSALLS